MFDLGIVEILILVLIAFLLETVLFWAAAALGDAPVLGWGKILLVSLAASVAWAIVLSAIGWSLRSIPLRENIPLAVVIGLLALLVTWVIPGILYAPLVPVSISRGMFISVVQVLLRIFLYVLIAAVVMVVLALIQIWTRTDARTEVLAPALTPILTLTLP
jgi:hypothetical protein